MRGRPSAEAGKPTSLDLSGVGLGAYTVDVTADQPVVAGVWSTTGFGQGADFAWYSPAPKIAVSSAVAVASGAGAALVLTVDQGAGDATVTLTPTDGGAPLTIAVPDGGSVSTAVAAGVYTLDPTTPVRAAVTYASTGAVAGYPLWSANTAESAVTVLP